MKTDPKAYFRMPLILGPMWKDTIPSFEYQQIEVAAIQYFTEPESINALLPDCYKPSKDPLVTVVFGYYNGLEFMAGGGYNVAVVQVEATFDGNQDQVNGDYILVMFEDQTWPIICGREDLGIPKLYSDVSAIKTMSSGRARCEASYWGHFLFGIELSGLKKQNSIVRKVANKVINSRPWLAYKYIPSLAGPPDADYPTISYNDVKINELWLSNTGSMYFGNVSKDDIGHYKVLIDNLSTLPILRIKQCLKFRGSAVLRYDKSRRLN